jgi:hypothetical protein
MWYDVPYAVGAKHNHHRTKNLPKMAVSLEYSSITVVARYSLQLSGPAFIPCGHDGLYAGHADIRSRLRETYPIRHVRLVSVNFCRISE